MNYEIIGSDDPAAATIVVSAGLGGLGNFWRPQVDVLISDYRVILYDQRGTGRNAGTLRDECSIGAMADDVIEILDASKVGRCHFLGHALGGLIGLNLALRKPHRLLSLIIVNAWAKPSSHTERCFSVRRDLLIHSGVAAYVRAQPIFLYPAAWLEERSSALSEEVDVGIAHFQGERNLLVRMNALLRFDISDELSNITLPTLVAAARDDVLVPWTCSEYLASRLRSAELWLVAEGGHAFTAVNPSLFNGKMIEFLRRCSPGADTPTPSHRP